MEEKKETRSLQVKLTEKELLDLSRELVKNIQELRDKENRKKEFAKIIDGEICGYKTHIDLLSMKIANGYEYKDIECTWEQYPNEELKRLSRDDTGEVVKTEQLTKEDRQKSFL